MSLQGCAPTLQSAPRVVASVDASRGARAAPLRVEERKVLIVKKIAPRCGSPIGWSVAQTEIVASFMEKTAGEEGQKLEAAELERLNNAVKICRGDK